MNETTNSSGIAGYTDPTEAKKELVNKFKQHEMQLWALIDEAKATGLVDPRTIAVGVTQSELAYMAINRSIFQPMSYHNREQVKAN